ncbi:4Fe-4S dicluster domain-containing protein [Maridesulfovibrio sp.]|uniref:4Fe-4S dicluster domain-containing protein n=1 Tax=Maridesulfovibrio sp. TaxID=2795000 RepID=UPI0029C9C949|nr:4Fe-4S dicluster domain-containing protein [Maridesulfovibrio sp.]
MNTFVLAVPSRCIGCRACEIACVDAHMEFDMGRAMEKGQPFSPRISVVRESGVTAPVQCRQCEDAPCAAACPVGAISFDGQAVVVDAELCFGCKGCLAACPLGAMQVGIINAGHEAPVAHKCDLCSGHREQPACVSVCPAGALSVFSTEALHKLSSAKRLKNACQVGFANN